MGSLPSGAVTLGCSGFEIGGEHKIGYFQVRELSTSHFPPSPQQGSHSSRGKHQKGTCQCSQMSTHPMSQPGCPSSHSLPGNEFPSCGFPVLGRRWGWGGINVRVAEDLFLGGDQGHWSLCVALSPLVPASTGIGTLVSAVIFSWL